jgi:hypothetical protein
MTYAATAAPPHGSAAATKLVQPAFIHPISGVVLDRLKELVPEWVPAGCAVPGTVDPAATAVLSVARGGQFSLSVPLWGPSLRGEGGAAEVDAPTPVTVAVIETLYDTEKSTHILSVDCPGKRTTGEVVLMDTSGQVWQQKGFDYDKIRGMVDNMVERLQSEPTDVTGLGVAVDVTGVSKGAS